MTRHFEFNITRSEENDGWEYTNYFIDIQHFGSVELGNLPEFIIESIVPHSSSEVGAGGRIAIYIRVDHKYVFNESVFWTMVVTTREDYEELVRKFVLKVNETFPKEEAPWTSDQRQLGANAIETAFDIKFDPDTWNDYLHFELFDIYLTHLKHCDMEHEVKQHDYMTKILGRLRYADVDRSVEWILFRITHGQWTLIAPDIKFDMFGPNLIHDGCLKKLISRMIEEQIAEKYMYMHLLRMAYGRSTKVIDEIWSSVEEKLSMKDIEVDTWKDKSVRYISESDEWRRARPTSTFDTGYHIYQAARWAESG